jgi:hypothetical protein
MALLRMKPAGEPHTRPKPIFRNVSRNQMLSTRLREELCLIFRSLEGQGVSLVLMSTDSFITRWIRCRGNARNARNVA